MSRRLLFSCLAGMVCLTRLIQLHAQSSPTPHSAKTEDGGGAPGNVRTISFSGHEWRVKSSTKRVGPGSNYFSDQQENVKVDERGRLHLRITQRNGHWCCAEIVSRESFGLGTYRFTLATSAEKIDPNVTLGLFTWSDAGQYAHREIDVECGKWGKRDDTNNAQFVVQPYQYAGHLVRFRMPPEADMATYEFNWESNLVRFQAIVQEVYRQKTITNTVREWKFARAGVPQPGGENARINLWISGSLPDTAKNPEVIVSKFEFGPLVSLESLDSSSPDTESKGGLIAH